MSDSYPLVFPLFNSPAIGGSEASLGIGPSFAFDSTGVTSVVCHLVGTCAGLDVAKSVTCRIRTTADVQVALGSDALLGTFPTIAANGQFSVSFTVPPPAGVLQWLVSAQTDSVGIPSLSELTLILEVVRASSSRYPALLATFQSTQHIFVAGAESFGDGLGVLPFSPEVDFSRLGPKFQLILSAATGFDGSGGRARIRIGGGYETIDGSLVVDSGAFAAGFHVWSIRQVVDNIWSSPQPLKVTGMSGIAAIGPTLMVLPW